MTECWPPVRKLCGLFRVHISANRYIQGRSNEGIPGPKKSRELRWDRPFSLQHPKKLSKRGEAKELVDQSVVYTVNKKAQNKFQLNNISVTSPRLQFKMNFSDDKKHQNEKDGLQYYRGCN